MNRPKPGDKSKTAPPKTPGPAQRPARPRGAPKLNVPPPDKTFRDRDGQPVTFPDSELRRVAAGILSEKKKLWRYRPFAFPLFTDKGNEQSFFFDFYVYDNQEAVIRLILVVARESREAWDKLGRFKKQYPMYHQEVWTPEKLAAMQGPRAQLGF